MAFEPSIMTYPTDRRPPFRLRRSGQEDNLPRGVTSLELRERCSDVVERVGSLDRHDEVARRYRHEHLVGPGLRTRHVVHLEDLDATVIVESNSFHKPITFR